MIITVTGASGFIGKQVISCLLQHNCEHTIIATSRDPEKAATCPWFNKVEYVPCDLRSDIDYFNILHKPDCLIHLAWSGLPSYMQNFHYEENLPADYRFIQSMLEHGLKRVFISGTCFEYGLQSGCLDETTVTAPVTCYGFAKDTLRRMLEFLFSSYPQSSLCWGRLFYMYGPGQSQSSFISLLRKAVVNKEPEFKMSGGEQLRDFLPVEKVAAMITNIATDTGANGIYNICSGKPRSLLSLAEEIIAQNNSNIRLNRGYYPYPDYEPMAFWGNNSKWRARYE